MQQRSQMMIKPVKLFGFVNQEWSWWEAFQWSGRLACGRWKNDGRWWGELVLRSQHLSSVLVTPSWFSLGITLFLSQIMVEWSWPHLQIQSLANEITMYPLPWRFVPDRHDQTWATGKSASGALGEEGLSVHTTSKQRLLLNGRKYLQMIHPIRD